MRKRAFVMLGLALLLGVVSVFLLQRFISRPNTVTVERQMPTKTVVVARVGLSFGNRLGKEHLQEVSWPANNVPPGAFNSVNEILGSGEDRVVLRTIEPNEPVLASKISGLGGRATLSTLIDKDMRAMTIRVNDVNGVAGFVLPGDRVDVMLTREQEKENPITDVLLQNVKVLGIDQDASDKKDKPVVARAVTLEVTPDQAQKLTLGGRVGVLSLALRALTNADPAPVRTVGLRDLRSGDYIAPEAAPTEAPKKAAEPPRPAPAAGPSGLASVRIVRGTSASQYEVRQESAAKAASSAPAPLRSGDRPAGAPNLSALD